MRKTSFALGLFSLAMLTACVKNVRNEAAADANALSDRLDNPVAQAATDPYESNEVLVKFKKGASEAGRGKALGLVGGTVKEKVQTNAMKSIGDEGFYVVHTPAAVLEAVAKLKGAEEVEFAEPNYIYTYGAASVDPYFTNGSLWGMYGAQTTPANQYGSNAAAAWAAGNTGSATVYVGIIDEGIQFDHPDLAGQVWTNPNDPVDGIDNDGDGYIDDIHGWDFDGNDNSIYDGGTRGSLDDHGTHVSGTIAGKPNTSGVVGMNWNVTLISGKFLGRRGGTTANAVKAVDYFTYLKTNKGVNIVATNNSWGGGGFSQALYNAISHANDAGILFIAAAGNGGSDGVGDDNDAVASYPSNYDLPNVIAVASITSTGAKSSFSNYGLKTVDLGAPGSGIYSTTAYNTYSSYSGTSMATPHVTGAVALYASVKPGSTAAQIRNAILSSAVPTSSLSGKTVTGGRLDVYAALSK
jgi:subtilisin family serine protease